MSSLSRQLGWLQAALLLSGCTSSPPPLYYWAQYQDRIYQYFQGDETSQEEQIAALEEAIQQARASGSTVPPGLHAHLGLLYAKLGRDDQVRQQFETEKRLFPESAPFMDFLLDPSKGDAE